MRLGLTVALLCTSCALDWTVGSGHAEDGGTDSVADRGPSDSETRDVASSDARSCSQLEADVDSAKLAAKQCSSMPDDCMSKVEDQCGCVVFVAQPSNAATTAYVMAIQTLQDSGCALGCATCPAPPAESFCLPSSGDSGLGTACDP